MKATVFEDVSLRSFWEIMGDFATALETTFPDCAETKDWGLYMRNVVKGDDALMRTNVGKWCEGMQRPLKKAKYAKAVQSITGAPATTYHAVAYRDIDALELSFESLHALRLGTKLKSDVMNDESKSVFWKYMEELNKHSFVYGKVTAPKVPTPDEIAADIQRRKGGSSSLPDGGPVLQQGLREVWQQLCESRGNACDAFKADDLHTRILAAIKGAHGDEGGTIADGCRAQDATAFGALANEMPELRGDASVSEQQWSLLEKALGLSTMEDAIPAPMMRGIESVANQLVKDIAAGKTDLASLNIEAIGQQVLSGVNEKDVSSFAGNLDKILPALTKMQRP